MLEKYKRRLERRRLNAIYRRYRRRFRVDGSYIWYQWPNEIVVSGSQVTSATKPQLEEMIHAQMIKKMEKDQVFGNQAVDDFWMRIMEAKGDWRIEPCDGKSVLLESKGVKLYLNGNSLAESEELAKVIVPALNTIPDELIEIAKDKGQERNKPRWLDGLPGV